jgi:hypothetical protein
LNKNEVSKFNKFKTIIERNLDTVKSFDSLGDDEAWKKVEEIANALPNMPALPAMPTVPAMPEMPALSDSAGKMIDDAHEFVTKTNQKYERNKKRL